MKSVIYYFTGTGNSLEVAKRIAAELTDCKLVSMGKWLHDSNEEYDTIGFVYPAYAYNMPLHVAQFLRASSFEKSKNGYFFAVTTCGGKSGCALPLAAKLLAKQGITLHFAEEFRMVSNAVAMYKMNERNAEIQQASTNRIPALAQKIAAKTQQPAGKLNGALSVFTASFMKLYNRLTKEYTTSAACTGCGTCAALCPVGNIKMQNEKPSFQHDCQKCMACIQWCPTQALNYKNKTQNRGRYHNTNVSLQEIIEGNRG